ncbi:MAG: cold shock domain-containing protein [Mesorhizobium sp.]|nr:MAG: cold shock domain-containing protein [Mesorhizobium sp.]TIN42945.1 MAG: cold shock domain-containing protein [Mesorhizobium sp.]TJU87900.1 MAG: cold shock domain-containing protein [Mesorhizobium sp.]TJU91873.1 MAG: cold shock domain-containing protein [Mesorhizobium sp.]
MSVETIMGKYRDQREPRRRRYDDDPVSFSERASEPSYFQRPSTVTAEPVDAEVIWFNTSKGFGFVKLSDGTEAYLHIRVLEAAGSRAVSEGTRLKVAVEEKSKRSSDRARAGDQRSDRENAGRCAPRWGVHRREGWCAAGERGHGQVVQSRKGVWLHCPRKW